MNDKVHDTYRPKNMGLVDMPSNSKAATSDFYVDRSRLRTREREEYVPTPKGGDFVKRTEIASLMDNARRASGEMGVRGSFRNETDKDPRCWEPCNTIVRDRGDE